MTPPPSTRGGRRAELLEAAVDVVAESGLRGLTHRAVDARAGLPEGTCSAYLRTRLALLVGLTEHVGGLLAQRRRRDGRRGRPPRRGPRGRLAAVTDLLLQWLHRPEIVRTQAELALEAARRPELMDVFDPWRQGLVRVVEELVRCTGRTTPRCTRRSVSPPSRACSPAPSGCRRARRPAFVRAAVPLVVRGLHVTG